MASKLEYYSNLADRTAMMVSGSYQSWTSFLTTVGRLYKYPYHEQLMIYAQRPEATACADYHLWNDRMGRYIRGKGTGIALIDTSGTTPALKYVFDIADTGARKNSRTPFLFEFREEHETAVAAALEEKYSAPKQHTVSQQIENSIHNMLIEYWDDHRQDICDNIDGSYLADYDEYNIGVSFQNAAEVSATYAILSRCGLDPDSYFEHEDFLPVFDFNTPGSLGVLGAAVSQTSETVLRTIEVTIKRYEREKLTERSQNHEQPDLQNERRLPDSQSDPQRTESAAPGQIRNDAQSVPAGASSGAVEQSDSVGEAVPPSAGSRTDSEEPAGTDDDGAGEGSRSDGSTESIRPDEVGGADELPESAGGGDYLLGADLQLIEEIPVTGEQISLFLPESEQIQRIDEAERVGKTPSAFSMPQNTIDHILRDCGNTAHHREFVSLEFMKQKSIHEIAKVLPEIYRGGYGLKDGAADVSAWFAEDGIHITPGRSAQFARTAQILSWEDAAVRIGQLLEAGFFASNVELVEAPGLERSRIAERLVEIEQDLVRGTGKVYLPTIAQARGGSFPEEVDRVKSLLLNTETREIITKEYIEMLAAKKVGEQVSHIRIYEAEKTFTRLAELAMPRTKFHSDLPTIQELFSFITDDEINAALSRGPAVSGGKERIYSFFREDHSAKEITSFLKEQYGIGGHTGAIPGCFRSFIDYDGKGITITKPGCPRAELKWSKVAQHIQELVRSGRYITPEELSTFQEKQQAKEKEAANTSVSVWAYNGIKEAHPDDIVLFQMGDLYEMYGQDARTVAPFLNLTLTQRKLPTGGTIEMCGFRSYALEDSLNLLRSRFSLTVSSVKENEERNNYSLPKLEPPKEIEETAKIDQTFEYRLLSRLDMDCKYFLGNGMRAERHLWAGNVPEQIAEMRKLYDRLVIKPEWITAEDIDSYERQMLAEPVTPEVKTPESLADRLVQLIQVFEPESYTQTFGISGSEVALVAQVNDALKEPEAVRHYLEVVDSYHDDTDIPELTAMIDGLKAELEALPQEPIIVPPAPTVKITQADVDAAIQKWNGDITSKHSVVRYMREHGQEQSTAAWLALEFGGDPKEPFHVSKEGAEDKVIPWSKVQVRIETLIERERFYTEQEYDNMDDIDPIAIRERLADSGIVDGQLADEEKLNNNPFIRQVMADVERIAAEEGLEEETENPPNHSAHSDNPIYPYSVNQSVYLEDGTEFVIEGISDTHVKLLDHSLLYPITRVESVESFKRLMERYPQPQKEETPFEMVEDESAEPPEGTPVPADSASQMELAKQLITDFCMKEYGGATDFSNLEQVGVAYTTLSDKEIPVQVNVNLVNFSVETLLGDTTLETRQYDTLEDLINQELKFLDFQDLTYVSEEVLEQYPNLPGDEPFDVVVERTLQEEANSQQNYHTTVESVFSAEKNNLPYDVVIEKIHFDDPQQKSFIDHYYVVDDLDNPEPEVSEYKTLKEALDAYKKIPTDRMKSLGAQNTNQIPGSLDFLQCVYDADLNRHRDVLITDYLREPGWDNSEVDAIAKSVERYLDEEEKVIIPAQNFHITDSNLGVGGAKEKFRRNMNAINLLHELEFEGRQATPEEQEVLAQYVGWGGLADAFDESKPNWADEFQELYTTLSPEEYKAARGSTLNAHYTSPTVIKAMYDAIGDLGFQTGNILEPSMGVGNFFGMLPESMAHSRLYGVELDDLTGRIAKQLYPKANITISGFEKTDRKDFFDLAVGNVPFGQYQVNDPAFNKLGFSIHNYFFAKALDQLRPGGVLAFVTSRYTMDSKDTAVRRYLAERADLLGAIRLPNTAFKANAGTEVVSDIIFLQKRESPMEELPDWVSVVENQDGYLVNSYFDDNPHMVLGEQTSESTRYGMDYTVIPSHGKELFDQLAEAVKHIHGTYQEAELPDLGEGEEIRETIPADPAVKNYSYTLVDGQVYYRENSIMAKPKLNATAMERVKGLIGLRECVKKLIDLQMDAGTPDFMIRNQQAELNELYDDFTAKYGLINDRGNRLAFSDDPSYYLLSSLEILDEDKKLERKADMFFKRTIREAQAVTSVETASEALAVSIAEHACVDMPYMAQLSGKTEEEIASELRGVIFRLPGSDDDNPQFVTADEYLSGNVRKKLEQAQEAAKVSPIFQDNVDALLKAQPKDLEASEIDVRLGATWIDKNYIQEFMMELLQPPYYMSRILKVNYSPFTAEWNITGKGNISMSDVNAYTTYGTVDINAYAILENTLNLRDVKIYDTVEDPDGKERRVLNAKKTTLAQQKQQIIKDAFREWIWKDPERRQTLVKLYNEKFNADRPREYDGSHITFNGMNPEITLREHQRNAIAHILYGGNTLLAHEVGAGKTFEVVGAAMESKRLGLCTKSLIVVPNHLTEQWASEFLRLYPSANILVARKKDFEPARRKTFCSKIATGDYDAVIIGHSQFEKIPMSMARQQQMIQDQINEIEDGIMELKMSHAEKFTVKSLERTKKALEARLEKLNSTKRKDDVVTFEQLGVDRLFVDEAHSYKNLFLYTKMQNVAGISTTDAQKSSDMYMKCQYMDEKTGGRGVVFATGTPISNSMTELYTMMRYLQSRTLAEKGWSHFDCWAAHFGETKTVNELAPEGKGYRTRTRFAKFYNLPELINIWKEAADVKTADQLHLPRPEPVYHTEVAQPTETQQELVEELSERAADVHTGTVDPRIDNMLKITSDGRKLGLDQRIINPNLPDEEGTKLNMCVSNILRIWKDGEADKLTQLVFCDISTPKAKDPKGKTLDNPTVHALEALDAADSSFTAYDDIRSKLIAGGIPAEQIAFIHDANTDVKKKELFAKVRSGQVRVLMGSTFKMGAGMNVQDRLVALHDLDCPWRPGDLEQRSGRIIRQGNRNKEVHIFRYVTESTFDAYLWQTVENKQKFISQIMTSKSPVRSCEDVDETALSYAEIKALCAGDSRIKEKMDLEIDVARLKVLKADFQSQHYRMEDQLLKYFPQEIAKIQGILTCLQADMKTAAEHPHPEDGFAGITIKDTAYTDKEQAGAALMEAVKEATNCDPVKIGTYRGFTLLVTLENFGKDYVLNMMGEVSHKVTLGNDPKGNIVRMENSLNDMDRLMKTGEAQIQNLHEQMDHAKAELGKTFPQEAELAEKQARLADLTAELNLDEQSKESQTKEKDSAPKRKPSVLERLKQPLSPSSTPNTKKDERRNDLDR